MTNRMQNLTESKLIEAARHLAKLQSPAIVIEIVSARGSTPRDEGTQMLVTADSIISTIGGGQLERIAIEKARQMLVQNCQTDNMTVPLGPEIGQCCGGSVSLSFALMDPERLEQYPKKSYDTARPCVQIHGAGHTGKALAKSLALLPVTVALIDSRNDMLEEAEANVEKRHTALPEREVSRARAGTAFVVLTHEHQLDFMIAAEALARKDAAYVGMIGSATKKAVFANWLKANGYATGLINQLTCPIGGQKVRDKRPEVIAALVASELIATFSKLKLL